MANISVTYSFSNGSTADATEVNTNFQDIIDGTSDGSKDFSISALTCAGNATFNANTTIGNATSDDLTITARVASDVIPKTDGSLDLGSSSLRWAESHIDHNYVPVNDGTNYDEGDPPYSFSGDTDTGMYSEGANQVNLSTGGTAALSIDSNQILTFPSQPAFKAYISTVLSGQSSGAITELTTQYTEVFDQNADFDATTTGRFTAPVDGIYLFSGQALVNTSAADALTEARVELYLNSTTAFRGSSIYVPTNSADQFAASIVHILSLSANDTVSLRVFATVSSGTWGTDAGATNQGYFMGAKIA